MELMADSLTRHLKPWDVPATVYRVEEYGAKNDGVTVNTLAIQKAIDDCSANGGGTVLFSQGDYVTGTIELKSDVMLKVAEGARILGSLDLKDYPEKVEQFRSVASEQHRYRLSLIYAECVRNVGICGKGEINFRGERENFPGPETATAIEGRPFGIRMIECSNVVMDGIFLHNAAAWMQCYLYCENLLFDGMKVINQVNYNNDGLDLDGCRNVIVRNCYIRSEDDAFCLKGASGMPNERMLVENSTFYSTCNAFKFGTDTQGDFRDIYARNLTLGSFPDRKESFRDRDDCSTGITLETVDGGAVENILIEDVTISRARCPIYMYIGDRMRVLEGREKKVGTLGGVVVRNVTGTDNRIQGSLITGLPGHTIKDVVLRDIDLQCVGGGTEEMTVREVPLRTPYPDAQEYLRDGLPAYGFYIRHAENVEMQNVKVTPLTTDKRSMLVAVDAGLK